MTAMVDDPGNMAVYRRMLVIWRFTAKVLPPKNENRLPPKHYRRIALPPKKYRHTLVLPLPPKQVPSTLDTAKKYRQLSIPAKEYRQLSIPPKRYRQHTTTVASVVGAQSFLFRAWIRRFPGVSVQRILFSSGTRFYFVSCGEIMTQRKDRDPETGDSSSSSSSAQSRLQPTVYNVTTLPRPAAEGNTMRV